MTAAGEPARSPSTDTVAAAVAQHVRSLRTGRGWSLDELAGRSGVSKGMVVQIEGAKTNPSIGTLCRLADAFGVTIARLLESPREPAMRIVQAGAPPVLWRGPSGGAARLLSGINDPDFVELWDWRLEPGESHSSPDHAAGTREMVHVLTGALTVRIGGVDHRVGPGETALYLADRPHRYANLGEVPVLAMMVVAMPPGEFDRRGR